MLRDILPLVNDFFYCKWYQNYKGYVMEMGFLKYIVEFLVILSIVIEIVLDVFGADFCLL